jgi:hypothetical protein
MNRLAASVNVAPQFFDVRQSQEGETSSRLDITNRAQEAAVVTVHAKDWFSLITADPAQFRLEPGQQKAVVLNFYKLPAGMYQTDIIVQARDIGTSLEQPPFEAKIPARLDISRDSSFFHPGVLSVAAVLIIATLLLFAYIYSASLKYRLALVYKRLRAHTEGWLVKQPHLRPYIIAGSVAGVLLVFGVLVWGMRAANNQANPAQANHVGVYRHEVAITTPNLHQLFQLETEDPITAFGALQKISEQYTIPIEFQSSDMGVFVTSIAGMVNGTDSRYWVYEVNDQKIPVASDAYQLQPQDKLVWKFTFPE